MPGQHMLDRGGGVLDVRPGKGWIPQLAVNGMLGWVHFVLARADPFADGGIAARLIAQVLAASIYDEAVRLRACQQHSFVSNPPTGRDGPAQQ